MKLKGTVKVKLINENSKDEHKQAFILTEENEEIRIRMRDSNPFQDDILLSEDGVVLVLEGELDNVSGTFIANEIQPEEE